MGSAKQYSSKVVLGYKNSQLFQLKKKVKRYYSTVDVHNIVLCYKTMPNPMERNRFKCHIEKKEISFVSEQ